MTFTRSRFYRKPRLLSDQNNLYFTFYSLDPVQETDVQILEMFIKIGTRGRQVWTVKFQVLYQQHTAEFKVCKAVHRHTIPINQPTRCKNFSSLLLDVYVQLNMFRASSRPSSGAQQLQ